MAEENRDSIFEMISANWQMIKETLCDEYEINYIRYFTWIEPLQIYKVCNNTIYILVPYGNDEFVIVYLTKLYRLLIQKVIEDLTGSKFEILFLGPKKYKEISSDNLNPLN